MSGVQHYRIDVFRSCAKGVSLKGAIPLVKMPRLAAVLMDTEGQVEFDINFHEAGAERYRASGRVQAKLTLSCQRCLHSVDVEIDRELRLGLVQSDQEAELLDAEWDPQIVESPILDMVEVIEDELLLSIPAFPAHDTEAQCEALGWEKWQPGQNSKQTVSDAQEEKENPFAILEQLKKH